MSEPNKKYRRTKKTANDLSRALPGDLAALEKSFSVDNTPPHDLEAEQGILGALLLDPLLADDIVPLVHDEDFYLDAHRRIYRHLVNMRAEGSGIDLILLQHSLQKSEELDAVGGIAYIGELMRSTFVTVHAEAYARIVHEKALLRRLIHVSAGIVQDAFRPDTEPQKLLSQATSQIFELSEKQTSGQVTDMQTAMQEVMAYIDIKAKGETDGVPTGFAELDRMTDGLHPNELIILAARPSIGKTAFATNIAEHVAVKKGMPVLIVSLEMAVRELGMRLVASRGRVSGEKIKRHFLSASDNEKLLDAVNELSQAPLFIDDAPSRTVAEIAAIARRLKRKHDLRLLVIDYLGLIEPENSNDPRQEQVAKMARRLKSLSRELSVPILCLAQLNRQAEMTKDNRPQLAHLRESGAIEQDADVVLFVHREDRYMDRETAEAKGILGQTEIIIAKQRNGPVGTVKLAWVGQYTRFENLSNDEDPGNYADVSEFGDVVDDDAF